MFFDYGKISEKELSEWVSFKEMNLVYLIDEAESAISVTDLDMHYYLNYKFYVFLKTKVQNQWFILDSDKGENSMRGLVYTSAKPIDDVILDELKGYVKKYAEPIHNN